MKGRSQVSFVDWMRMDLAYARRRTLFHDVKIIAQTVPAECGMIVLTYVRVISCELLALPFDPGDAEKVRGVCQFSIPELAVNTSRTPPPHRP